MFKLYNYKLFKLYLIVDQLLGKSIILSCYSPRPFSVGHDYGTTSDDMHSHIDVMIFFHLKIITTATHFNFPGKIYYEANVFSRCYLTIATCTYYQYNIIIYIILCLIFYVVYQLIVLFNRT